MRFERNPPVIDFDFEFPDGYQNPEASGQHLPRINQKRERTEGCVLFQDGYRTLCLEPRNLRR